jgi:hypothetical protein
MTIELSKFKERDALQMNELTDLRQTNAFIERVSFYLPSFFSTCFFRSGKTESSSGNRFVTFEINRRRNFA